VFVPTHPGHEKTGDKAKKFEPLRSGVSGSPALAALAIGPFQAPPNFVKDSAPQSAVRKPGRKLLMKGKCP
jgi:hypothetical protein